jgi:hypothetical protein
MAGMAKLNPKSKIIASVQAFGLPFSLFMLSPPGSLMEIIGGLRWDHGFARIPQRNHRLPESTPFVRHSPFTTGENRIFV